MKNNNQNILVIGTLPPPIGGVTIHVKRLLECLDRDKISYAYSALTIKNLPNILKVIPKSKLVHLHTSNVYVRIFLIVWSRLVGVKLAFTLHGNLGRYGFAKNTIDEFAIRWANFPIVINEGSYQRAKSINSSTQLLSAFIPPVEITPLDTGLAKRVDDFRRKYSRCYCTNAYNLSFDKEGKEIYGISELIKIFLTEPEKGLIFSDPSGNYKAFLQKEEIEIAENVLIIGKPHDFINILKSSDVFLRTTTTDGDSLSVREGLYFDKSVITSDCVKRPNGCLLYRTGDTEDLRRVINDVIPPKLLSNPTDGYLELREFYSEVIDLPNHIAHE